MKRIHVGLIGFGTIGGGVANVLLSRRSMLRLKAGIDIKLTKICDKDLKTKRPIHAKDKKLLTKSLGQVLYDPTIDIVIELIGGVSPAKEIILEAIRQGKHVVTANKALLALHGKEIFDLAKKCGVRVEFEASAGGGIPIIRSLKESLVANRIELIYGIINGTSNFILSKMNSEGIGFKAALKDAQQRGYAEKNPALDISGGDSAHKLAILSLLGFDFPVKPDEIYAEGIGSIERSDIIYAREQGYAIKPLAIAKRRGKDIELRVHPTLIPKGHLLANVNGIYNAIYVRGDLIGESLFYGEGAGRYPTASSVVADVVSIAKKIASSAKANWPLDAGTGKGIIRCRQMGKIAVSHYIRFSAVDKPGVLARISGILGRCGISIASVTQKQKSRSNVVPIVMMTHTAQESDVAKALKLIDRLDIVKRHSVRIRIEEQF